ncbi:MAG: UDP-N-acetylmuramate--L-alanine ligase [Bacteroidales bacterium]
MNLAKIHSVYFIGIGGIGMSALARYFHRIGKNVAGYDRVSKQLTNELIEEGIDIHFIDSPNLVPEKFLNSSHTLVVYTPAIAAQNRELHYFTNSGFTLMKRAQVLGLLSKELTTLAVAGTHGKTSVSSFTTHILNQTEEKCNAFLGGISKNLGSNVALHPEAKRVVIEADEFDRSFLTLYPDLALITTLEEDHLDIYGDRIQLEEAFTQFVSQIKRKGILILHQQVQLVAPEKSELKIFTYSIEGSTADYRVENIRIEEGRFCFDVVVPGERWSDFELYLPGRINVENALAAISMAHQTGVPQEAIRKGVRSFTGVQRRFDYHIRTAHLIYLDDYAHHPTELRRTLTSIRELYPDRKITGIFQPHLYSRTRDFAKGFGEAMNLCHHAVVLDIYPAREDPIPGVSSELIYEHIESTDKILLHKEDLLAYVKATEFDVLITMGAGDIDRYVKPIKLILEQRL